jgi:uncharacterized protein with HEPN domain
MRPDPRKYLWDAQHAAELLRQFSDGKTFAQYETDAMLRSAVERQLEIIGEALNQLAKVDTTVATQIPELGRIVALRNILIHGYAEVDNHLVWQAITVKLPELENILGTLLNE